MRDYKSVKQVINKLLQIEEFEKNFNKAQALEWIGDGIFSIKGGVHLTDDICAIPVKDYIGDYPDNYMRIVDVYYQGQLLTRDQRDKESRRHYDTNVSSEYIELLKQLQVRETILDEGYVNVDEELLEKSADNINFLANVVRRDESVSVCLSEWFEDKPNCIKLSFEQGTIIVDYKKFAVDHEGYPLVYDHFDYTECLFFYTMYMFCLSKGKLNEATFYETRYIKYLGKAQNHIKMMDTHQMEEFRLGWANMLRGINETSSIYQN